VKLIQDPVTHQSIAVKYFSGPNPDSLQFVREFEMLSALKHRCVLRIVHWSFPAGSVDAEIHTEYAEQGSLADVLRRRARQTERFFCTPTRFAIAICDIVIGMRYVHSKGIVHRDLKPSNVLIRRNGRALIGDFGSSRFTRDDATQTGESGTPHYAAPEQFQEHAELTPKIDVWSFGLILYEIVSGSAVFPSSLQPREVARQIRARYRPPVPRTGGDHMGDLIERCWSQDPLDRPSFADILREFQSRQFAILPSTNIDEVRDAVEEVLQWESKAGVLHS
jgi:serine/threonine protein kinase